MQASPAETFSMSIRKKNPDFTSPDRTEPSRGENMLVTHFKVIAWPLSCWFSATAGISLGATISQHVGFNCFAQPVEPVEIDRSPILKPRKANLRPRQRFRCRERLSPPT
jgi:hypothetical protein